MPSCNTYHLTWVSLTLGMGCLFTAAPAKHSRCFLTLDEGYLLTATLPDLQCGIAPLGPPAPAQPPLLRHGLLFPAVAPGLRRGVAPPVCCPDLGRGVAPPVRHPWPQTLDGSSRPFLRRHSLALLAAAPDLQRGVAPLGRAERANHRSRLDKRDRESFRHQKGPEMLIKELYTLQLVITMNQKNVWRL